MGCRVRRNRHGYLGFRLRWNGLDSLEGTTLRDTSENRAKVEARARIIDEEIRKRSFDYLRWFPDGNLAERFRPEEAPPEGRLVTLRGFFETWGRVGEHGEKQAATEKQMRPVSAKWASNRASWIRKHVLPSLGTKHLDQLVPSDLTELQRLLSKRLKPMTVDGVIHSALRGMLRDADLMGYRTPDLGKLYDRRFVRRLDQGGNVNEIDPYTEEERDAIIEGFRTARPEYHAFVFHQFWTGARPSEAAALRWGHLDLLNRRIRIRGSRVLRRDGRPKTGKSKRDVVIHGNLSEVLRDHRRVHGRREGFIFTTPNGAPIDQVNFYAREWVPMLEELEIRVRPFYNARHTYITYLLSLGTSPLFVARQTGTSLEMIETHYGGITAVADELDELIREREESETGNPPGTFPLTRSEPESPENKKALVAQGLSERAGDRGRTGDVQLGKLAFYR